MSWPMTIIETPSRSFTSSSVCATTRCTTTSSALVGSSAMISGGFRAMAMAIQTRCFMPPLNSCGYMS